MRSDSANSSVRIDERLQTRKGRVRIVRRPRSPAMLGPLFGVASALPNGSARIPRPARFALPAECHNRAVGVFARGAEQRNDSGRGFIRIAAFAGRFCQEILDTFENIDPYRARPAL